MALNLFAPVSQKLAALRTLAATHGGTPLDYRTDYRYQFRPRGAVYNPEFPIAGERHARWIEDTERAGLRRVGWSDDVLSLRHKGWFTEDDGDTDEVLRGSVYQLPARDGSPCFVYGYDDPHNEGAALLVFETCDDKLDAARYADGFAERVAEHERDYRREEARKMRIGELRETIVNLRTDIRALVRDLKATRRDYPAAVCKALREHLANLREQSRMAYLEIRRID